MGISSIFSSRFSFCHTCIFQFIISAFHRGCRALRRPLLSFFMLTHSLLLAPSHSVTQKCAVPLFERDGLRPLSQPSSRALPVSCRTELLHWDWQILIRLSDPFIKPPLPCPPPSAYRGHRSPPLISSIHSWIFYQGRDSTSCQAFIRVRNETQSSAGIDDIYGGLLLGLSIKRIRKVCALLFFWGGGNETGSLCKRKRKRRWKRRLGGGGWWRGGGGGIGGRFALQLSQFVLVSQRSTHAWQDRFFSCQSKCPRFIQP